MSTYYGSVPKHDSDNDEHEVFEKKHGNYWKCYSVFALLMTMMCFFPMVNMTIGPTAFYSVRTIPFENSPTAKPSGPSGEASINNLPGLVYTNKPT